MARKTPFYRPVSITIWDDIGFHGLSDDARQLWLFFLTSSECPIPGILIAGESTVSDRIGWPVVRVRSAFVEIVEKRFRVAWEGRVLWCMNGFKHQPVCGPKAMVPMATAWRNIPDVSFKHDIWRALRDACRGWSDKFRELFDEPQRRAFVAASPVDQIALPILSPPTPIPNPHTQPPYPRGSLQEQQQQQDLEQQVFDSSFREPSTHGGGDLVQPPPEPAYSSRTDRGALELFAELKAGGFRFPLKGGAA